MTDGASLWQRCPACGGSLTQPMGSLGRQGPPCPDCGRPTSAPEHPYYGVYDALEYEFDDVTPAERAAVSDLLAGAGIPYRWDPAFRLQVPSERERDVDDLFENVPPRDASDDPEDVVFDVFGDSDGLDEQGSEALDAVPAEWAADEASVQALASLFDACDRLRHDPDDDLAAADLADATGVVRTADLPIGVNPVLWRTAGYLARQLFDLLEDSADRDDVVAGADALRAVLRDHI